MATDNGYMSKQQKGKLMAAKSKSKRTTAKPITVQEFAAKHEVGERKLRRVLRSLGMGVGRGERYTLNASAQRKLSDALSK